MAEWLIRNYSMNKPHYGIDAPPVIKQLFFSAIISLTIGIVAYVLLVHYYPSVAFILLAIAMLFCFTNMIFTILMFCSSLFGKLIMRDRIIKSLHLNGDEQVLDVGCGRGLLLKSYFQSLKL